MEISLFEFGDNYMPGFGILNINRPFKTRSLFAIFYNKEDKELLLNILFLELTIK